MATERLIVLDIGILMGSRSPQVFEDMVSKYPGAQEILAGIKMMGCECGDPMCAQKTFQTLITMDHQATKEEAASFIEFVMERGNITSRTLRDYQHEFFTQHLAPRLNQHSVLERLFSGDFLGQEIPLVAIPPVEPEAPANNLDHDEPKHGGPQEE